MHDYETLGDQLRAFQTLLVPKLHHLGTNNTHFLNFRNQLYSLFDI